MLRNTSLFSSLSDDQLEALADRLRPRAFAKGMIIFHKDSLGRSLYLIESGKVRIFILSESGQEISVRIYGCGDVFGELSMLDGLPRSAGAVAMDETRVLTLDRDDFLALLEEYPQMAPSIISILSGRVRYTTEYAESLAFLDVYGRVAKRLLELADSYGAVGANGIEIHLRLTQSDLASLVGATRESVNKVLGTFRDQGLIGLDGQRIVILDRQALKKGIMY
jgi:CRP/FNR family transcriptional regulator/CRP/FNR family cyclic AMP-dependent transcriptional regulator